MLEIKISKYVNKSVLVYIGYDAMRLRDNDDEDLLASPSNSIGSKRSASSVDSEQHLLPSKKKDCGDTMQHIQDDMDAEIEKKKLGKLASK